MNNPLETEVGGTHYQMYVMQPVELFMACGWNYCQSNIAKYVLRHQDKNGKEDLEKALHICNIGCHYDECSNTDYKHKAIIETFVRVNIFDRAMLLFLCDIDNKEYGHVLKKITYTIEKFYN